MMSLIERIWAWVLCVFDYEHLDGVRGELLLMALEDAGVIEAEPDGTRGGK